MISGFTYIHNALHVGIPIKESILAVRKYVDEMVVVDAESNDGTREFLEQMPEVDRVLDGKWGNEAGETLARLHAMHVQCKHDQILHVEADEIISEGVFEHYGAPVDHAFYRIQTEQNFQRVRWWMEPVHRFFGKGSVKKQGHTTDVHLKKSINSKGPILWDVTNCFRDNWLNRVEQQARLWNEEPKYRMVPIHASQPFEITREQAIERLKEPHWIWDSTPLKIPDILKPLVGRTRYEI